MAHFPSGTSIVQRADHHRPWYSVRGPRLEDDDAAERERFHATAELATWLNGGPAPAWLKDLWVRPDCEEVAVSADGRRVLATGPCILRPGSDPAALDWIEDPAEEFAEERRFMAGCLVRGVRPDEATS